MFGHSNSTVTDVGERGESPTGQAKCKNGPHFAYISVLVFYYFSGGCRIFAFFEVFSGDLWFQYRHPHPDSPPFLCNILHLLVP